MARNKVYKFKIGVWVNNLVFYMNKNLFKNIVFSAMEINKEIRLEIKNNVTKQSQPSLRLLIRNKHSNRLNLNPNCIKEKETKTKDR